MDAVAPPNFCPSCGAPAGGGSFCVRCGSSLTDPRPTAVSTAFALGCSTCGGGGRTLPAAEVFCPECRWLRPLAPGYSLPVDAFLWALDAQAMNTLASIGPLNAAARSISTRFGRPWFEAAVNGVRLGPDQLPDIFALGVKAARAIGLPRMPELYVSGEQMWDAAALGDETDAFIVVGSVLTNFRGDDLFYLLAREMGHVAAGHGLWRTVTQVVSGKSTGRNLMAQGVMKYINPAKLIESAVDVPLMAWARHAEITADRAGALAVGDETVARRVAVQWTLRSFPLEARLNPEALERQFVEADTQATQAAEWTMSSAPYLSRRMRLMSDFFRSDSYAAHRAPIRRSLVDAPAAEAAAKRANAEAATADTMRLSCPACGEAMRVPRRALADKDEIKVRCPNAACGKVLALKRPGSPPSAAAPPPAGAAPPSPNPATPPPDQLSSS